MRASPRDKAFLDQLRGALNDLSAEASAAGRPAAEQHVAVLRQLLSVLWKVAADPNAAVRQEEHPLLHSDAGRFLLTVCGFEEVPQAGPPAKGRPTAWRMPPGAARAAQLASDAVGRRVAELESKAESEAKARQEPKDAAPAPREARQEPKSDAKASRSVTGTLGATLRGLLADRHAGGLSAQVGLRGWQQDSGKGGSSGSTSGTQKPKAVAGAAAAKQPGTETSEQPVTDRQAVSVLVQRVVLAAAAKVFPAALHLSDEEVAIATALEESMQTFEFRRQRPGTELSLPRLGELGVSFERQPDGTDTCAIHCLNNIVQARLPPEDAAAAAAAAVAAAAARQAGEAVDLRGLQPVAGPFGLGDLQMAEVESRRQEGHESFLAPSCASMLRVPCQRMDSFSGADGPRTGMFDVEAVKAAARAKGFEVIDIEPAPTWAETAAAHYVKSAREMEANGSAERWFLGFVVYERLPGRAMHYYSLLRWPRGAEGGCEAKDSEAAWLVLDSLDRGAQSPRNRLMSLADVVGHYDANGEWFKSWLVRWYPVVDRAAAVAALQGSLAGHVRQVCGEMGDGKVQLGLSVQRAEAALDGDQVRWDVSRAKAELLKSAALVERELQVLRLAVSEQQARWQLESAGWAFERAVRIQAERMLQQCAGDAPAAGSAAGGDVAASSPPEVQMDGTDFGWIHGTLATYSALQLADWNVRSAAQVLLLSARAEAQPPLAGELWGRLRAATAALEASDWDLDRAMAVLRFLRSQGSRGGDGEEGDDGPAKPAEALTEAECHHVLELADFDTERAQKLLSVRRRFSRAPLAVCAEAFRREHGHPPAACALLEEFESRMRALVAHTVTARAAQEPGLVPDPQEVDQVVHLALDVAEWNPAIAFSAAENFAAGVVEVRRELLGLEMHCRARAMEVVQSAMPPLSTGASGRAGAAASEAEVAAALATLDTVDELKKAPPSPQEVLRALQESEMHPGAAAAQLWECRTGLPLKAPARPEAKQPQRHRLPPQTAAPPPIGGKGHHSAEAAARPSAAGRSGASGPEGARRGGAAAKKSSQSSWKSPNDCDLM